MGHTPVITGKKSGQATLGKDISITSILKRLSSIESRLEAIEKSKPTVKSTAKTELA